MQRLDLNVASRPFRNNAPIWIGLAAAAAAVCAFTVWSVSTARDLHQKTANLEDKISGARQSSAELDSRETKARAAIARENVKALASQTGKANEFLLRKGLSWTRLFNLLEQVQPPEVRMTAVRPIFGGSDSGPREQAPPPGTVPVSVEGLSQGYEAFLEFQRALLLDPHFTAVQPLRAETVKGGAEVSFDLRFLYDPEGRLKGENVPSIPPVLAAQAEAEADAAAAAAAAKQEAKP